MKHKLLMILAGIFLLGGLAVALYPSFKTGALLKTEKEAIRQFEEYRAEQFTRPSSSIPSTSPSSQYVQTEETESHETEERAFQELWAACMEYNGMLASSGQERFEPLDWSNPQLILSDYGWEQEMFGYLSIPTARIEAPLYLGCTSQNLNRGAAILGNTSLPIGGENTNCVIAGHRTWDGAICSFVDLEKVAPGDLVYLTNPWTTLTYRVVQTKTILPDDSEQIRIQEGKDLLTVFTCTYPNTHRYLVICERIDDEKEDR